MLRSQDKINDIWDAYEKDKEHTDVYEKIIIEGIRNMREIDYRRILQNYETNVNNTPGFKRNNTNTNFGYDGGIL